MRLLHQPGHHAGKGFHGFNKKIGDHWFSEKRLYKPARPEPGGEGIIPLVEVSVFHFIPADLS